MEYADYLAHYGILGMRWGIRRFQSYSTRGRLSGKGGKEIGEAKKSSPRHTPSSAKKLAKQRAAALEKARQAKAAKKQYEDEKQNALTKGTAKDVLKFKGDLTNKELQDAYSRLNTEQLLSSIASRETKTTWDKIGSLTEKIGKMTALTGKGIEAWNTFAKINNSFSDSKLTIISGENKKEDPEKKRKQKLITEFVAKYGTAKQVIGKSQDMTYEELKKALEEIEHDPSRRKMKD